MYLGRRTGARRLRTSINALVPFATVAAYPAIPGITGYKTVCSTVAAFYFFVIRDVPKIGLCSASWFQLTHLFSKQWLVVRRKKRYKAKY